MNTMQNKDCVKIPNGIPPSECISFALEECSDMIRSISTLNRTFDQLIWKLQQALRDAEKLRRNLRISKTTGTVAASVGTTLTVIGLALTPFTFGLSVPFLCGTGAVLAASGGLTNLGTTIAEVPITKSLKQEINKLIDDCKAVVAQYVSKSKQLEENLRQCDFNEFRYFDQFVRRRRLEDIKRWLRAGHLHKDTIVAPKYLRKGDHIFRKIRASPLTYHHGIYISDNTVVEFTSTGVQSRSLEKFAVGKQLSRRDYNGYDLPTMETEELVEEALRQESPIQHYDLLTNNCEHFATSMKLKVAWSGQADTAMTITSEVFKNIPRPISLLIEGLESGTQVTAALTTAPKSIFSIFGSVSTPVMSNLAKAAIFLGPVTVALDITFLVLEYKKKNESADVCKTTIKELTQIKEKAQDHNKKLCQHKILLTERLRIAKLVEEEVQRLEVERIE